MRWDHGPLHLFGTTKYIVKFAILPRFTDDSKLIWLEKYIALYMYENSWIYNGECWSKKSAIWDEYKDVKGAL